MASDILNDTIDESDELSQGHPNLRFIFVQLAEEETMERIMIDNGNIVDCYFGDSWFGSVKNAKQISLKGPEGIFLCQDSMHGIP